MPVLEHIEHICKMMKQQERHRFAPGVGSVFVQTMGISADREWKEEDLREQEVARRWVLVEGGLVMMQVAEC